jgi:hypothetical protein
MTREDIRDRIEALKQRGGCKYAAALEPHEVDGLTAALALEGLDTVRDLEIALAFRIHTGQPIFPPQPPKPKTRRGGVKHRRGDA